MARARSMKSTADVVFSGPFFQHEAGETLLENIHKMMEGIATEGETAARQGLMTGAPQRKLIRETGDRVAEHAVGRVHSVSGKEWMTAAVVGVNSAGLSRREAISVMAAASYVESRTGAIGRVTRQLRSARAVLRANLTASLE